MSERLKRTATVIVIEEETNFEVIDEKLIKGEGNPVKRLIRLKEEGLVNNLRIILSEKGLKSGTFFAGQVKGDISPEKYREHYRKIDSKEGFSRLSEQVRKRIIDTFRAS